MPLHQKVTAFVKLVGTNDQLAPRPRPHNGGVVSDSYERASGGFLRPRWDGPSNSLDEFVFAVGEHNPGSTPL